MGAQVFHHEEKVSETQAGTRLDAYLLTFPFARFKKSLAPSRSTLQKWIAEGCVLVDGRITKDKSYRIRKGSIVSLEVAIASDDESPPPEPLDIRIVHQDPDFVVIDKPPGITSHPVKSAMTGSVVNFLHYRKIPLPPTGHPLRPGIVHRLDKNTGGLMVVACTDRAAAELIEMIRRRDVEREYMAIVYGNLPLDSGTIEAPVGRHVRDRKKMAVARGSGGKPARTNYRVLTRYPGFSLVACKLDTGRTHQIRVHMSHFGYPVAGDPLYGGRKAHERIEKAIKETPKRDPNYIELEKTLGRIAELITSDKVHLLHAARLRFPHPVTGRMMSFRSQPFTKFTDVLNLLEKLPHKDTGNVF